MRKIKLVVTAMALLMVTLVFSSCSNRTAERYLYEYHREAYEAQDFLPTGFASYESVYYDHDKDVVLWFVTDTMTVRVKYDDSYSSKKNEVEQSYKFLTEPIESDMLEGHYDIPVTEFEYKGFRMRVADGGEYPKKFGIVGCNDETKEIAYLWFNDPDMDFISEPDEDREQAMIDFVDEYFSLK